MIIDLKDSEIIVRGYCGFGEIVNIDGRLRGTLKGLRPFIEIRDQKEIVDTRYTWFFSRRLTEGEKDIVLEALHSPPKHIRAKDAPLPPLKK